MANRQSAKKAKKVSKLESLGLKSSQIVIVTAKIKKSCDNFQYVLKRPISPNILMDIFKHILHGRTLRSENSPTLVRSPASGLFDSRRDPPYRFSVRALIVDDEELVLSVILRQFSRLVLKVSGFDSSIKGLAEFKASATKDSYNAVIVDYNMPGMTGLEFAKEIRKYEAQNLGAATKTFIVCKNF